MKRRKLILAASIFAGIAALLLITSEIVSGVMKIRRFDSIEARVKASITSDELQAWAVGILAKPLDASGGGVDVAALVPENLKNLYDRLPSAIANADREDRPGSVTILWGGGFIGHCGFDLGSTNYDLGRGEQWQPGVYFWKTQ